MTQGKTFCKTAFLSPMPLSLMTPDRCTWHSDNLSNQVLAAIIVVFQSCTYLWPFRRISSSFNSSKTEKALPSKLICNTFANFPLIRWIVWVIFQELYILFRKISQLSGNRLVKGLFSDWFMHRPPKNVLVDIFWPRKVIFSDNLMCLFPENGPIMCKMVFVW